MLHCSGHGLASGHLLPQVKSGWGIGIGFKPRKDEPNIGCFSGFTQKKTSTLKPLLLNHVAMDNHQL